MAHNITQINGVWQFLHTEGKPGWHELGIPVNGGISRDDAADLLPFAMDVKSVPLFAMIGGKEVPVKGKAVTYREHDGTTIACDVVGEAWASAGLGVIFDFIDRICDNPHGKNMDTMGLLRDGKTLFIDVPLPRFDFEPVKGDKHETHLLIRQHASSYKLDTISTSAKRTVCENTEHMALGAAETMFTAGHNMQDQANMIASAEEVLRAVEQDSNSLKMLLADLSKVTPTAEQIDLVLGRLFPSEDGTTTRAASRRENRREMILALAENGRGNDVKGIRGTAYGFYNGITEYVTHIKGRESKLALAREMGVPLGVDSKQFESTMIGSNADILRELPNVLRELVLN